VAPFHPDDDEHLASTYWNLGQNYMALELELEVLDAMKEVLGEWHPSTLLTMNNFGIDILIFGAE